MRATWFLFSLIGSISNKKLRDQTRPKWNRTLLDWRGILQVTWRFKSRVEDRCPSPARCTSLHTQPRVAGSVSDWSQKLLLSKRFSHWVCSAPSVEEASEGRQRGTSRSFPGWAGAAEADVLLGERGGILREEEEEEKKKQEERNVKN